MAEYKVLQSKEELGLKSESSSGMSESSVPEIQEKLDLVDELSSVSLDIEKCQVVFKKESDVAGHKSTVTKETKVEAADGKKVHLDQSSSDKEKGEDLSAGKVKESEIGTSTGADKSDATSSDNGVDFNASLSVAATSEGKDSANQEKVNLEDELLSDESEATPVEKKVDMKDAPLVDQEKSQVLSSGKSKDLHIGSSTGTSDDKVKAIQEKLDLDDKFSSAHFTSKKESLDDGSKPKVITETQVEAAEGDENFPFNNSSDTSGGKDSANQEKVDLEDELSSGQFGFKKESDDDDTKSTDKSKATSDEKKVDMKDAPLVDQEKIQVLFSGKSKELEIESSTEDKVKAIQENLDLDDKHSSVGKEDNMEADENLAAADNGSPGIIEKQAEAAEENEDFPFNNSSVTKEAQVEAAEGNLDLTDNSSLEADKSEVTSSDNGVDFNASLSIAATSEGKDSANQEKVNLEDELLSGLSGFKKESDDDDGKSTVGQQASSTAAVGSLDFADNSLSDKSEATSVEKKVDMKDAPLAVTEEAQVEVAEGNQDLTDNSSLATSEGKDSANQEKVNLEDELLSGQFGLKKESDDDDGKSKVGQQASSTAAVGSLDFADNSLSDKSEATPVEKKVDMKDAPLVDKLGSTEKSKSLKD